MEFKANKKEFLFTADADLLDALKWKAKQLRSSSTRVLRDYLLTLKQEQESARLKEVIGDGIESSERTEQSVGAATGCGREGNCRIESINQRNY